MTDTPQATKGCIENLPRCKASCCRSISFEVDIPLRHPMEDYYLKRGLRVLRLNRGRVKVFIPHRCEQLDDEYKCKLHGTPEKPLLCRALNEETAQSGRYDITENCIYGETDER